MQELWEKAAKTKPQDLQVQLRWFTYAFEGGNWKSAQKVSFPILVPLANHFIYLVNEKS
jgi:N-terminal acetyltransferase B complex non-catalytic subunit